MQGSRDRDGGHCLVGSQILDKYRREGFVILRDVIDDALLSEVDAHVAWLGRRFPGIPGEQLGHELMRDDPFWVRLISDDRLLDIAEVFVGPDIALFASHYISKPPRVGQPVLWHQDGAFWPLQPMDVVTLWLAVDRADPDNGCMRVVPGSHEWDLAEMREATEVDNVLGKEIAVAVDESRAVDIALEPGDVEVHHPSIVHGSNPNTSPRRRCGLTIRYIPTSTRIVAEEQPYPSAFHLRGDPGVNRYQARPRYVAGQHMSFRGSEQWR
jgi:phytanoyl-CoA hydroxylase